jgi:hypothetical protein
MLKRHALCGLLACAAVLGATPAARAQQTVNFSIGYLTPKGEDARVDGDVLVDNRNFLVFDMDDFNGGTFGGEWLVGFAEYFEAGAGVAFYRRTVPSVYADYVDSDGTEIDQELKLRMIPIDFTARVLPFGQSRSFQPYFGAGLSIVNWRYSETGEFVADDLSIFRNSFVDDGNAVGPVVLGGVRFASDTFTVGGEIRYHAADADLSTDFFSPKIDLGGWRYQGTIGIRFGR